MQKGASYMFGKRLAYEYAGGYGEEQRTPPWLRHRWSHRHPGSSDARRGQGSSGPSRDEWRGWTPPWLSEEWRGAPFVGLDRGRGAVGPRGPFGFGGV